MTSHMHRALLVVGLLGSSAGWALADGPKHAPPQAAFDACAKSKQAEACTFTGRRGRTLKGTCEVPQAQGSGAAPAGLVCRPTPGQMGGGGGSAAPAH